MIIKGGSCKTLPDERFCNCLKGAAFCTKASVAIMVAFAYVLPGTGMSYQGCRHVGPRTAVALKASAVLFDGDIL